MVILLEVSPISMQDLWSSSRVTIGFLVTALLPQLFSLASWLALGRVLLVLNFVHLRITVKFSNHSFSSVELGWSTGDVTYEHKSERGN